MTGRRAVFLDRDGTLIDELGYLASPEGVRLYPGAGAAVRRLNEAGVPVCLVTNQSGVARGLLDEPALERVHARLRELLAAAGAHVDAIYSCPHHPSEGAPPYRRECECRKPRPGMLLEAARELDLDLPSSWMIGDAARDLQAGQRAGCGHLVLVRTGKGRATEGTLLEHGLTDAHVTDDLAAAVELVLSADRRAPDEVGDVDGVGDRDAAQGR